MLSVEGLSLRAGSFELKEIGFSVAPGGYLVILGPSGAGKSLLLEAIAGLRQPHAGRIRLRGRDVTREPIQRRGLSIVCQDADLFPHLTVRQNIAYPLRSRAAGAVEEQVRRAAERTGISDQLDRKPGTLSGGEYQRAALARSLAAGSDLFLLDEPLAALDKGTQAELRALLRGLRRNGAAFVHVTHDFDEALSLADRIGILEQGRLAGLAEPEEVFRRPASAFVASFVGAKNFFKGSLRGLPESDLKEFSTHGLRILCLTDAADGEAFLTVRPEDVVVSRLREETSSRNHFPGKVVDLAPSRLGVQVVVDAGLPVTATISAEAQRALGLRVGEPAWVSFKAASCLIHQGG
ncbi:MAG: ATP-binding cassette domain-containing protein [Elusimicrobia bacterium]|nr:ATP-binding cassette domain-containing protein [Elusimicrobiota bacterium]